MLRRLSRKKRSEAGRLLALVYLFCVLAPTLSFAVGEGGRAAPRLLTEHLQQDGHVRGIHRRLPSPIMAMTKIQRAWKPLRSRQP